MWNQGPQSHPSQGSSGNALVAGYVPLMLAACSLERARVRNGVPIQCAVPGTAATTADRQVSIAPGLPRKKAT